MKTSTLTAALAATFLAISPCLAAVDSIPEGYTRLEWLASTADTPYIDTGYTPSQFDKITVRFRHLTGVGSYEMLYCARKSGKDSFSCLLHNSGKLRFDYNGGEHCVTKTVLTQGADYIAVANGNTMSYTINGTVWGMTTNATSRVGTFTVGNPLRLFASETETLPGRFRIYYFRVENNAGVAQADLRPCRRDSDGKLGMYDLVRETFCPAGGTGTFETNETGVPSGYSIREWIQSSGTQWVNTEFTPLCFDSVSTTFRFRDISAGNFLAVFCARKDGKTTFSFIKNNDGHFRFDHNKEKNTILSSVIPTVNTDYTITMNGTTLKGTVNGGNEVTFNDAGIFTVGSPMTIFAAHGGTISDANMTMKSSLRLFSFAVTDSATDTILCELQPCVRTSDNKPGLYDRINKRFLTNCGTGEFKVPDIVTVLSIR